MAGHRPVRLARLCAAARLCLRRVRGNLRKLNRTGLMTARDESHWDGVYASKSASSVSWYRPHLERSLSFIDAARLAPTDAIIDVGGGASTLVDDLLDRGFSNVTVLDLSPTALRAAQHRLGKRASAVQWMHADLLQTDFPQHAYAFWHDRAVFHFLTAPAARALYVDAARMALRPGGHIVVATFGPHGPERCSGLDVVRYSPNGIRHTFGDAFVAIGHATELHETPWGTEQEFVYCYCRLPTQ
jgi:SAM-dependent methyltransferase